MYFKPLIMYFTPLIASIGTKSKNMVVESARYLRYYELNRISDELAIIIWKTHYTEVIGDRPLRKHNSRAKMEIKFGLFKMKSDMTLSQFYQQFVEYRRIFTT